VLSLVQKNWPARETLALQVSVDATFLQQGQDVEAEHVRRDEAARGLLNQAVQIKVRFDGPSPPDLNCRAGRWNDAQCIPLVA
jgi:hypothetical protein